VTAGAVDLVHGPRVAVRDQEVPVGELVDRVQVPRIPRAGGRRAGVGVAHADAPVGMPLVHDEARLDVDLLGDGVQHHPVRGAPDLGEVARDRGINGDQRVSVGQKLELVQVRAIAVARLHRRDAPVGAVQDVAHALAEPGREDHSLPPREHRLSVQRLRTEVQRGLTRRPRRKPDHLAAGVQDHRPRRTDGHDFDLRILGRSGDRRDEYVGAIGAGRGSARTDLRGMQIGSREEGLRLGAVEDRRTGLGLDQRLEHEVTDAGDGEGDGRGPGPRAHDVNPHELTLGEAPAGDEARAPVARVGEQLPGVAPAARAGHRHPLYLTERRPLQADLGQRRGVGCLLLGRDEQGRGRRGGGGDGQEGEPQGAGQHGAEDPRLHLFFVSFWLRRDDHEPRQPTC